ncbi:MAG: TerB family tellurite resistance protein [Pseudomonadota bacterium]|nr:TerB family tellurite resistance protein [Pseudomonadota bacterium]
MFKKITTLFDSLASKESEKPDPERLSYLAATALMIELSRADNSIDQQEIQTIIAIATDTFGLSDDEAADILSEAKLKNAEAISLYEFTDTINQSFNKEQKYNLIRNIWRVAYADKTIDAHEDYLVRKVADLIYVSHADFIKAKHEASKL